MNNEEIFQSVFADSVDEQTDILIDGAAEKVTWAKAMARNFLEYANELEERAEQYRHLAAIMILEANGYAEEVSKLLTAEYPTGDDFAAMLEEESRNETDE
jgi:hypothetical protein